MSDSQSHAVAQVLGVSVEAVNMEQAVQRISAKLGARRKGYICMANVHGIMEAHRSSQISAIYAQSLITLPDGTPTVWVGRLQGHRHMQRVAGPDLMREIFRREDFAPYTHFFYGGKEGVAEELRRRFAEQYPWARIVGTWTPPYGDLTLGEERELIGRIRRLKPDIIWVGISTPRQERFMHRYLDRLETTLMFGVGAAYDFHTGRIKDAPQWVKSIGMQWLHRLLQDPRRLWKRYLRSNSGFLWHIALQLAGLQASAEAVVVQPITGETADAETNVRLISAGVQSREV
jgi:N-acetylglucosaminyldiphosphoundecaprenol N-acetyl-beta-D-mannosaminyltransferase